MPNPTTLAPAPRKSGLFAGVFAGLRVAPRPLAGRNVARHGGPFAIPRAAMPEGEAAKRQDVVAKKAPAIRQMHALMNAGPKAEKLQHGMVEITSDDGVKKKLLPVDGRDLGKFRAPVSVAEDQRWRSKKTELGLSKTAAADCQGAVWVWAGGEGQLRPVDEELFKELGIEVPSPEEWPEKAAAISGMRFVEIEVEGEKKLRPADHALFKELGINKMPLDEAWRWLEAVAASVRAADKAFAEGRKARRRTAKVVAPARFVKIKVGAKKRYLPVDHELIKELGIELKPKEAAQWLEKVSQTAPERVVLIKVGGVRKIVPVDESAFALLHIDLSDKEKEIWEGMRRDRAAFADGYIRICGNDGEEKRVPVDLGRDGADGSARGLARDEVGQWLKKVAAFAPELGVVISIRRDGRNSKIFLPVDGAAIEALGIKLTDQQAALWRLEKAAREKPEGFVRIRDYFGTEKVVPLDHKEFERWGIKLQQGEVQKWLAAVKDVDPKGFVTIGDDGCTKILPVDYGLLKKLGIELSTGEARQWLVAAQIADRRRFVTISRGGEESILPIDKAAFAMLDITLTPEQETEWAEERREKAAFFEDGVVLIKCGNGEQRIPADPSREGVAGLVERLTADEKQEWLDKVAAFAPEHVVVIRVEDKERVLPIVDEEAMDALGIELTEQETNLWRLEKAFVKEPGKFVRMRGRVLPRIFSTFAELGIEWSSEEAQQWLKFMDERWREKNGGWKHNPAVRLVGRDGNVKLAPRQSLYLDLGEELTLEDRHLLRQRVNSRKEKDVRLAPLRGVLEELIIRENGEVEPRLAERQPLAVAHGAETQATIAQPDARLSASRGPSAGRNLDQVLQLARVSESVDGDRDETESLDEVADPGHNDTVPGRGDGSPGLLRRLASAGGWLFAVSLQSVFPQLWLLGRNFVGQARQTRADGN